MIRKLSGVCLMAFVLASCEQKLSATLYLRDVQQMMTSSGDVETPVDIKIDILEAGMENQCERPSGKEIVDLVSSYFEKASLVGCEKIAGSLNGRMSIKVTTRLSRMEPEESPSKYLLEFRAEPKPNETSDLLFIRFDTIRYADLQTKLKRLNGMVSIKVSETDVALTINNDLRTDASLAIHTGVFVDGRPLEFGEDRVLKPREEALLEFGDVKSA